VAALAAACFLIAAIAFCSPLPTSAQEAGGDIAAQLNAGEFGPALAAAGQVKDLARRDELFGQIAAAQAASGASQGSIGTVGEIASDLARKSVLDQMAKKGGFFGPGGGVVADFGPLIDLIQTTISPESWVDVGGPGSIKEFASGVYVDPAGS
jgi:hypothetical protein